MDNEVKVYLRILLLYGSVYTFLMISFDLLEDNMNWVTIFENAVAPIITGVFTAAVTYFSVRNSQVKSNTEEIHKLRELLGDLKAKKNFVSMLGNDAQDRVSLADDHQSIIQKQDQLIEDISLVNFNIHDRYEKSVHALSSLEAKEYDIGKAVGLLADQWAERKRAIEALEQRIHTLEENIDQLQGKLQKKENELALKDNKINELAISKETLEEQVKELKETIDYYENPTPPTPGLSR